MDREERAGQEQHRQVHGVQTADDPSAFGTNRVTAMPMPANDAAPSTISSTISHQFSRQRHAEGDVAQEQHDEGPSSASTTAVERDERAEVDQQGAAACRGRAQHPALARGSPSGIARPANVVITTAMPSMPGHEERGVRVAVDDAVAAEQAQEHEEQDRAGRT